MQRKLPLIALALLFIGSVLLLLGIIGGRFLLKYSHINNTKLQQRTTTNLLPPKLTLTPQLAPSSISFPLQWSTYRNENYGYEIQYPKDWEYIEALPRTDIQSQVDDRKYLFAEDNELQKITFRENTSEYTGGIFQIRVLANPKQFTLDQWARNYRVEFAGGGNAAKVTGEMQLGGHPAKEISLFAFSLNDFNSVIVAPYREQVYYLTFPGEVESMSPEFERNIPPELKRNKQIYDQMISSFTFIQ